MLVAQGGESVRRCNFCRLFPDGIVRDICHDVLVHVTKDWLFLYLLWLGYDIVVILERKRNSFFFLALARHRGFINHYDVACRG